MSDLTLLAQPPTLETRPSRVWAYWQDLQPHLLSLGAGLLAWEVLGWWLRFPFLPPFSSVLTTSWQLIISGRILSDLSESLGSLLVGAVLAAIVGVGLGALMGRYRRVEYLFDLYVNIFLSSPSLIYVPVLFALFGVSRFTQTALVFLYAVFVIIANTFTGIRSVDPSLIEMARSYGANERQLFWRVLLPGALPLIMVGLRTGMARAVKGMINGEMVIALVGLGAALTQAWNRYDIEKLLVILLIVILVAVLVTGAIQLIDRRVTRWLNELS